MGRIAFIFLFIAIAAAALGGLPTLLDVLAGGDRDRVPEASARFSIWPTFDANAPRKPALHVSFADPAGNTRHLGQFQGHMLLVNFWATWCAPCRRELPSLLRLQERLSGEGLRVILISTDREGAEIVEPFLEANDLVALRSFLDPDREAYAKLGAEAIPTTILVDRIGREIGRHRGSVLWDNSETVANLRQILRR